MSVCVIGVDLGGTNMRAGAVDAAGAVLSRVEAPTLADERSGEEILAALANLIREAVAQAGLFETAVPGAGIGIPGPLDPAIGGAHPPNLKQLSGLPLTSILQKETGLKILLENDANAAAWGEFWIGAGRGMRSMVQVTLGTGIGGGLVLGGELLRGIDHTAGELGHVTVVDGGRPCACGSNGCIEAYASANSTVRRCLEALDAGRASSLADSPRGEITCEAIFRAAEAGDALARELVDETGRLLGVLAANMANLLNPEAFVLSGGMIRAGEALFAPIRETCRERAFSIPAERMRIVPAALGGDAGLIGAAGCALTRFAISR
jgi:glucokinase